MKKADRQRRLLEIISTRRYEKISRLAEELNVSHDTISRDLNELTESASFYITCGKHTQGIGTKYRSYAMRKKGSSIKG